jgi:hypothetical protein
LEFLKVLSECEILVEIEESTNKTEKNVGEEVKPWKYLPLQDEGIINKV